MKVADSWRQVQTLTAVDGTVDDLFGISVDIDDDRLVIGARDAAVDGQPVDRTFRPFVVC